jgi:hypothetical protein
MGHLRVGSTGASISADWYEASSAAVNAAPFAVNRLRTIS